MAEIVQCLIVDDEPMAREILNRHLLKIDSVAIVASCKNAIEAFSVINSKKVDLIFLDIKMPEISGLSFAKSINRNVKIIFTTAYRDYAIEGFDLQAVDYLLKPISFERLLQAIHKYLNENTHASISPSKELSVKKNDFIFVRSNRKMVKVNFDDIQYIESLSDYVKIFLLDKMVVSREAISSIEARLPKKDFIRVHRSYIVSKAHIISFTNEYVELNEEEIPISRSYKKEVMERLDAENS